MRMTYLVATIALTCALPALAIAQDNPQAATERVIESLEKVLPDYEQAADAFERAVAELARDQDPLRRATLDAVRLQVRATRSVRTIIAEQPSYLQYHVNPASLARWKEGAEYYLACARDHKDPLAGMLSGVRTFRTRLDDEILVCPFTLPKNYDPAKKYPLHVDLHSGGGFSWLAYWVPGKPSADPRQASRDEAIHIRPAGRQHVACGEVAVLEAIADAQQYFSVDPDRVQIGGASYGGTGGFHFGTLLPDRFAAAHSLTGGGNYAVPVGNGRFDAYLLADNLAALPFLIWDAPKEGHYQANHAFISELAQRAQRFPGSYPYLEVTDPNGGHGVIDRKLLDEGQNWLNEKVRDRYPRRVVYQTHCLRYDGVYWAHIDTVIDPPSSSPLHETLPGRTLCNNGRYSGGERFGDGYAEIL